MISISRRNALLSPLAALAAALLIAGGAAPAQAQLKPFKITGSGTAPEGLPLPGQPPRLHRIEGTATHLGKHHGSGTVKTDSATVDPAAGLITGEFGSGEPFVFVGANGDELACNYGRTDLNPPASVPGSFVLTILGELPDGSLVVEALWIAEFVADPALSTGKFAGVTGSWVMFARSEPFILGSSDPIDYSWEGEGKLLFKKGK